MLIHGTYAASVGECDPEGFNHLVGPAEEPVRNREAERLCGFQIDCEAEACRQLKGQVRRLRSFENAVNKGCHPLEALVLIRSIGHQATVANKEVELIDSRYVMLGCEVVNPLAIERRQSVAD